MEESIVALLSGIRRLGDAGPIPDTPTPVCTDASDDAVQDGGDDNGGGGGRGKMNASADAIELSSFSVMAASPRVIDSPRVRDVNLISSSSSPRASKNDEEESKTDLMAQALQAYTITNDILGKRGWKTVECAFPGIELSELSNYPCHLVRDPVCPIMKNFTVSRAIGVITGISATMLAERLKDPNHISRLKWDKHDMEDIAHVEEISSDPERRISLNLQWALKKSTFFQRPARDQLYFLWMAGSIHASKHNPEDREWKLIWHSTDANTHPKRPLYGSPYKREVFMQVAILSPLSPLPGQIFDTPRTSVTLLGWSADWPQGVSKQLAERLNFLQTLDKADLSQF